MRRGYLQHPPAPEEPDARHTPATDPDNEEVTAVFADTDAARDAALPLERAGIDASAITVHVARGDAPRRATDRSTWGRLGGRAVAGFTVGAATGAVLGMLISTLFGSDAKAFAAYTIGGTILGAAAGGFYATAAAMAVNTGTYDLDGSTGGASISVTGDAAATQRVLTDAGGRITHPTGRAPGQRAG